MRDGRARPLDRTATHQDAVSRKSETPSFLPQTTCLAVAWRSRKSRSSETPRPGRSFKTTSPPSTAGRSANSPLPDRVADGVRENLERVAVSAPPRRDGRGSAGRGAAPSARRARPRTRRPAATRSPRPPGCSRTAGSGSACGRRGRGRRSGEARARRSRAGCEVLCAESGEPEDGIEPGDRLLEPVDPEGLEGPRRLDRGRDVVGGVRVEHELARPGAPRARHGPAPTSSATASPPTFIFTARKAELAVAGHLLDERVDVGLAVRAVVAAARVGGSLERRPPPSSFQSGSPAALPFRSQSAMSIPAIAAISCGLAPAPKCGWPSAAAKQVRSHGCRSCGTGARRAVRGRADPRRAAAPGTRSRMRTISACGRPWISPIPTSPSSVSISTTISARGGVRLERHPEGPRERHRDRVDRGRRRSRGSTRARPLDHVAGRPVLPRCENAVGRTTRRGGAPWSASRLEEQRRRRTPELDRVAVDDVDRRIVQAREVDVVAGDEREVGRKRAARGRAAPRAPRP